MVAKRLGRQWERSWCHKGEGKGVEGRGRAACPKGCALLGARVPTGGCGQREDALPPPRRSSQYR